MKNIKFQMKKNNVGIVLLDRPDVRNAFNDSMIAEMTDLFQKIQKDKNIRAVILQGAGESFSSGGDLNWMKSMVSYTEKENLEDSEKLYEMYEALADIPVPVVCLVHGHAMGGGLGLIAACDITFADEDTQFCFSEVRLGLAPAVISAFVSDKVHTRDMHRFFLTGEFFEANEAFDMGLIHGYGDKATAAKMVYRTADNISKNGPQAVRATKKLIKDLRTSKDPKKITTEVIAKLRVSEEGQEGLKAFFEKRNPSWLESGNA